MTPLDDKHDEPLCRWQVKALGYFWHFQFDSWASWHVPESDARTRRAWWWLWHFQRNGRSCMRICGIALHSKATPFHDYSRYGV